MNYNKLQLFEFKLHNMVPDPSIVMIAKRGAGKSYVTRDIIYHYRHLPGGVVIAPTDKLNSFYKYFFPDLFIHYEAKPVLFQKILSRQFQMIEQSKKRDEANTRRIAEAKKQGIKLNYSQLRRIDPSSILIMDDCLASKGTWAKDQSIMEILMNGRHFKLTYVLTMQTPLGVGPELRLNFDYVFLLKEDSQINKKKLWENYASIFDDVRSFVKVFSVCTSDHKCMVVDTRKPGDKISDKIFWFKAQDRKFSFGSKVFKEIHRKYYDPEFMINQNRQFMDPSLFNKHKEPDIAIDLKEY